MEHNSDSVAHAEDRAGQVVREARHGVTQLGRLRAGANKQSQACGMLEQAAQTENPMRGPLCTGSARPPHSRLLTQAALLQRTTAGGNHR